MPEERTYKLSKRRMRSDFDPFHTFLSGAVGHPVVIDFDDVDRLDSARLRTLLSATRKWRQDGVPFRMTNIAQTCREGFGLAGLSSDHFDQEVVQCP